MIKLLYFGRLGDIDQSAPQQIEASADLTPSAVRDLIARDFSSLGAELAQPQVLVSVNQTLVDWHQPLEDGDELAFLPPVTGG